MKKSKYKSIDKRYIVLAFITLYILPMLFLEVIVTQSDCYTVISPSCGFGNRTLVSFAGLFTVAGYFVSVFLENRFLRLFTRILMIVILFCFFMWISPSFRPF